MLDWPEQSQTSPKRTSLISIWGSLPLDATILTGEVEADWGASERRHWPFEAVVMLLVTSLELDVMTLTLTAAPSGA